MAFDRARRGLVQLEVLGARPGPEVGHEVRLVPHLERPLPHLVDAVPLDPVPHGGVDQRDPLAHLLGRAAVRLPPEQRLGLGGELARHEPELHERAGARVEDRVEHLVDIRERVDRLGQRLVRAEAAAVVRAVDEHVVVEQAVEAHVPGAQHLDGLAEVRLPVRPQRLVRAASADALVPDVMQRHLGGCLSVDQQG